MLFHSSFPREQDCCSCSLSVFIPESSICLLYTFLNFRRLLKCVRPFLSVQHIRKMTYCHQFLSNLSSLTRFRLHTGNVNGYTQLKVRCTGRHQVTLMKRRKRMEARVLCVCVCVIKTCQKTGLSGTKDGVQIGQFMLFLCRKTQRGLGTGNSFCYNRWEIDKNDR